MNFTKKFVAVLKKNETNFVAPYNSDENDL